MLFIDSMFNILLESPSCLKKDFDLVSIIIIVDSIWSSVILLSLFLNFSFVSLLNNFVFIFYIIWNIHIYFIRSIYLTISQPILNNRALQSFFLTYWNAMLDAGSNSYIEGQVPSPLALPEGSPHIKQFLSSMWSWAPLMAQTVKPVSPVFWGDRVWSPGWEDPEGTHSSILAWLLLCGLGFTDFENVPWKLVFCVRYIYHSLAC